MGCGKSGTTSTAGAAAGLAELAVQWFGVDDLDGMAMIAERVLPRLSAPAGR